jgi:S-formylglutathione hydrolase FrmB
MVKIKKMFSRWTFLRSSLISPRVSGSCVLATLMGLFLFQGAIIDNLIISVISVGLDPLRANFIAALMMTAAAACAGAALGRSRVGALLGGCFIFASAFLPGFLQTQLKPVYDPGGNLEILNGWMLFHNTFVMLGLGLLSAFMGAAVGATFGEVVCDPFYRLCHFLGASLWRFWQGTRGGSQERSVPSHVAWARGLMALAVVALVVLAASSSDLFIFSPDIGIHTSVVAHNKQGQEIAGTVVPASFISPALGDRSRSFLVYLPPSYETAVGKTKHYPVLYLLHGSPGGQIDWVTGGKAVDSANTLLASERIPELIIVFPDGNGTINAPSEWGNSYDPKQQMETFVADDLVRYVDSHYRTLPDAAHRAIGGLSMGGFGAMNIAVHHPDVFGAAISLGGYYQAEGRVWGTNTATLRLNSPVDAIRTMPPAWHLHIYLGAATQDQPYYRDTLQFIHVLVSLHIQYQFDLEKGYHSWPIWQKQGYNALKWLTWGPSQTVR